MRIFTLWHVGDNDDMPWLVDAVDEYTVDDNDGFPPPYAEQRARPEHRELIIDVPTKTVRALFDSPVVEAEVIKE